MQVGNNRWASFDVWCRDDNLLTWRVSTQISYSSKLVIAKLSLVVNRAPQSKLVYQ